MVVRIWPPKYVPVPRTLNTLTCMLKEYSYVDIIKDFEKGGLLGLPRYNHKGPHEGEVGGSESEDVVTELEAGLGIRGRYLKMLLQCRL